MPARSVVGRLLVGGGLFRPFRALRQCWVSPKHLLCLQRSRGESFANGRSRVEGVEISEGLRVLDRLVKCIVCAKLKSISVLLCQKLAANMKFFIRVAIDTLGLALCLADYVSALSCKRVKLMNSVDVRLSTLTTQLQSSGAVPPWARGLTN